MGCAKIRPIICAIYRKRNYLPSKILQLLYMNYVLPHIDYAITIWGSAPNSHTEIKQNFMARIITNNFDYVHCRGMDMLHHLGFQNIKQRYTYLINCLTFKCLHELAPSALCDELTKVSDITDRPCRNNTIHNLHVPHYRTNKCKNSFRITAPILWNALPIEVKSTATLHIFKQTYNRMITV